MYFWKLLNFQSVPSDLFFKCKNNDLTKNVLAIAVLSLVFSPNIKKITIIWIIWRKSQFSKNKWYFFGNYRVKLVEHRQFFSKILSKEMQVNFALFGVREGFVSIFNVFILQI